MIVQKEDAYLKSIVLRLGGFHTQVCFLACMGRIMSGSGLREVLGVVYTPSKVRHIVTGKAVARAFKGHLLVDAALNVMVTAKAFDVCLPVLSPRKASRGDAMAQDDSELWEADQSQTAQSSVVHIPEDIQQDLQEYICIVLYWLLSVARDYGR